MFITRNYPIILSLAFCLLYKPIAAQGFLRTESTKIVNDQGEIILRGVGLGGWMLQEGYMLQTESFANTQHELSNKIEAMIGKENKDDFYEKWLSSFCRKPDVDSMAVWGFNSIRLPLHYNLFTLPIEQEPVKGDNTWIEKGFDLTDNLLEWCKSNEIYLILDLHAAPGGQGKDAAISDYDSSKPSLWESSQNRSKTVALWRKLAERYADEPWIGGYDLINETNWDLPQNSLLKQLYLDITKTIREVDHRHILFIEGNWFANDFTGLTPPWDENMVYSFHKYWSTNNQASIQWMLNIRNSFQIPIWCGEAGENSNAWFTDAIHLLEAHQIGWAWWPLKKVESISCPLSIKKPDGYEQLLNYWAGSGPQPSVQFARDVLSDLTQNIRLENCRFQKDVIDAMIRQVQTSDTKPYKVHAIPGLIFATDYDLGTQGTAYFDTESANYQVSTGVWTGWNNGWSYRNDGVDIEPCNDTEFTNGYNVGWIEGGEWLTYTVQIRNTGTYDIQFRVASETQTGKLHMQIDQETPSRPIFIPNTGGWQNWSNLILNDHFMEKGTHILTLFFDDGPFNLNYFAFAAKSVEQDSLKNDFILYQNRPNPFHNSTQIDFEMIRQTKVHLNVIDPLGKIVDRVINENRDVGTYHVVFEGKQLSSGIYFYILKTSKNRIVKKMILMK
jgi:endoglucanase